ncbi:MAG: TolC family protein [Planctomycetaceae bacterium]|nr:TolC family protein [Planctomycetaceae bacterium]
MPSKFRIRGAPRRTLLTLLILGGTLGCASTPEEARAEADELAYRILEERREQLALGEASFTIETSEDSLRRRLLRGEAIEPVRIVDVLQIAADNSRDYQRRKEDLYLAALDLTLEQFRFQWQGDGSVSSILNGDVDGAGTTTTTGSAGLSRLLGTGAQVVSSMGLSLARSLSTGDSWSVVGTPFVSVSQPLLRGFGSRIVRESLTQSERTVIYELREFERFRRTFAVDTFSRYIQLLRTGDQVKNERVNMANLTVLRERNEALAEAGRQSDIQTDQARQNELASESRLISAVERYGTALDDLKFELGLPIEAELEPVASELYELAIDDTLLVDETVAVAVGLALRLDYQTVLDQLTDSERRLNIAADNLRARLNVTASSSIVSEDGEPFEFSKRDLDWTLRADLTLPIQLIAERNAYREALITVERARRSAEQLADQITGDLRASLRQARTRRKTVDIQNNAVLLAERRVESATLSLEAGRATTRDILEAQQALVDARNALTTARVDYFLSQLALWRDMELLRVRPEGIGFAREELDAAVIALGMPMQARPTEETAPEGEDTEQGQGDGGQDQPSDPQPDQQKDLR